MKRSFGGFACLMVALAWPSLAATNLSTLSPAGKSVLMIDGVACDLVLRWDGGDLRGVVSTQPSMEGLAAKSIGSATVTPLALQVSLSLSPQLAGLVNDLCSARWIRHEVMIIDYNSTGVATAAFELTNAMLRGVTFPAFDASASAIEPVKLVFEAEQSRSVAVPGGTSVSLAVGNVSTFRLSIDGVDASRTMRIEPISIGASTSPDAIGQTRSYATAPASVEFSPLRVTFGAASAASWKTWWTDFVVNGAATDTNEKNSVLTFIDSSGAPLGMALNFTHVGIVRLSRPPATAGVTTKLDAEMYFEGLALSNPTATTAVSNASTAADAAAADPTASDANSSSSTSSESATAASSSTASPSTPTAVSSPSIASRTPIVTDVPLVSSTPTLSATQKTSLNPADVGSRDPAQFPRVEGLTRTYYDGTFQPTYTTESAYYTSTEPIEQLVARVDAAAKVAGWTMTTVTESAPNGGKSVAESWTKGSASASVGYGQAIDASGTKYSVQVYVRLPSSE